MWTFPPLFSSRKANLHLLHIENGIQHPHKTKHDCQHLLFNCQTENELHHLVPKTQVLESGSSIVKDCLNFSDSDNASLNDWIAPRHTGFVLCDVLSRERMKLNSISIIK